MLDCSPLILPSSSLSRAVASLSLEVTVLLAARASCSALSLPWVTVKSSSAMPLSSAWAATLASPDRDCNALWPVCTSVKDFSASARAP